MNALLAVFCVILVMVIFEVLTIMNAEREAFKYFKLKDKAFKAVAENP